MATVNKVYLKAGDTLPVLYAHLLEGSSALNLTNATVQLKVGGIILGSCTVLDATAGHVSYSWSASDLTSSGTYNAVFIVTYASGGVLTAPSSGYITVVIEPRPS